MISLATDEPSSAVAVDKSLDCEPFAERDFLTFAMAGESVAMERFRFSFSSLELSSPESSGVLKMP